MVFLSNGFRSNEILPWEKQLDQKAAHLEKYLLPTLPFVNHFLLRSARVILDDNEEKGIPTISPPEKDRDNIRENLGLGDVED